MQDCFIFDESDFDTGHSPMPQNQDLVQNTHSNMYMWEANEDKD